MKHYNHMMLGIGIIALLTLSGCSTVGETLNPFQESPKPEALLGTPNDHALSGGGTGGKVQKARSELQDISRYPKAHQPRPANPVVQPSVVRLMWVPDHLNKNGDLVPAHYYYLKVLEDRWAVTDVFDRETLINGGSGAATSSIPFTSGN
jgi:uncharacterized protein YceK